MLNKLFVAVLFLIIVCSVWAGDSNAWKARSIYQVLTDRFAKNNGDQHPCGNLKDYCGGTFKGIQNKLDYIASMGFDAIWISPVFKNSKGGYHGYWITDFYEINSYFGTAQDLKNLVNAAHSKGIWVMGDVVANHVGPVGTDFSQIRPFNKPIYYHPDCPIDNWKNQSQVETCRWSKLPDLDQRNPYVRKTLLNWVKNLVIEYKFDGLRIDTVAQVPPDFWTEFKKAAGVYQVGEVLNKGYSYIGIYQNFLDGLLNYPLFFQIKHVFGSGQSMSKFRSHYSEMDKYFKDQDLVCNFVDNHDHPRYLSQFSDVRTFKSALAFALSSKGIPITYYGSEQAFNGGNDPQNREALWSSHYAQNNITAFLRTINQARKTTKWYSQTQIERYVDDSFYAFSRGNTFFAFTNQPNQQQVRTITSHPYSDGQVLCNIFYSTDCVKVSNKQFKVFLNNGEVKVFIPKFAENQLLEIYI